MDTYTCKDGRIVELDWDGDEIVVWTTGAAREKIGSFVFDEIEDPAGDYQHITNMHLEGPNGSRDYIGQGIGREIVRTLADHLPVVFSPDDGNTRDDGSHLTGSGSGFARKMVSEGLASFDEWA